MGYCTRTCHTSNSDASLIGFEKNNICEFLYGKKNFKNGAFIASSSAVDLDIIKEHALSLASYNLT